MDQCLHLTRQPKQPSAVIVKNQLCMGCLITFIRAARFLGADLPEVLARIELDECGHNGGGHCDGCHGAFTAALKETVAKKTSTR